MDKLYRLIKNLPNYIKYFINGPCIMFINICLYYIGITKIRYYEKKVNNYKLLLDLHDKGISRELMNNGTREKEHIYFLTRLLTEGMVVLDIGANIGYYSVMLGKLVGENGKVYALEPSLNNFKLLNINIMLNDMVNIVESFNIGVSNTTGFADFYQSAKSNWHTFYPKVHSGTTTESLVHTSPIKVPVITIEDFIENKQKIDLIRMDIEGFEVEVFESMVPLLEDLNFRPSIIFEAHYPRYDDDEHNMKEKLNMLFKAGYNVKYIASNLHNKGGKDIFHRKGYIPKKVIKTDGMKRGIYDDISNDDALWFICDTDYVRTVVLERTKL